MATPKRDYPPLFVALHEATIEKAEAALGRAGMDHHVDRAIHWLGDLTRRGTKNFKRKVSLFVIVNAELHARCFRKRKDYTAMVGVLLESGVIQRHGKYIPRVRSRKYRVNPSLTSGPSVTHEIVGRPADTLRRAGWKRSPLAELSLVRRCPADVHASQVETLRLLQMSPAAYLEIEPDAHACYQMMLVNLREMRHEDYMPSGWLLQEDKYGRLHSPVTRLWSWFKQYLSLDGESLAGIDIKNSQPFFASRLFDRIVSALDRAARFPLATLQTIWLASEHAGIAKALSADGDDSGMLLAYLKARRPEWTVEHSQAIRAELSAYQAAVESGTLYEQIVKARGLEVTPKTRKKIKKALIAAFFDLPREDNDTWDSFATVYPLLAQEINLLKSATYEPVNPRYKPFAVLAHLLQMIESKYVYQAVCPALMAAGMKFVTIHDCFMVKKSQQAMAKDVIGTVFANARLYPMLAMESFGSGKRPRMRSYKSNTRRKSRVTKRTCLQIGNTSDVGKSIVSLPISTPLVPGDCHERTFLSANRRATIDVQSLPSQADCLQGPCQGQGDEPVRERTHPHGCNGLPTGEPLGHGDHAAPGGHHSEPVILPLTKAVG